MNVARWIDGCNHERVSEAVGELPRRHSERVLRTNWEGKVEEFTVAPQTTVARQEHSSKKERARYSKKWGEG